MITLIGQMSFTLPVDIIATYFTAYFLLPRYVYSRRFLKLVLIFLPSAAGFILLQRVLLLYFEYPVFRPDYKPVPFWNINWLYSFTNIYMVVFAVSLVKMLQFTLKQQRDARVLDKERIEAELKFLKAQVHPHFLFNTLNNLYALTLDKSDQAPEVVLKLSDLLNYMLYECNEPYMLISKEVQLINNYLELERIRYGKDLDLKFRVEGDTAGKRIAPMLLLPFIENAFKHGVSKVRKQAFVNIGLEVIEKELIFKVSNSKVPAPGADLSGYSEGIGLRNVKRRLELMYPGNFRLDISDSDQVFEISLHISLIVANDR